MSDLRKFLPRVFTTALVPCFVILSLAFPAAPQSNNSNCIFLLASGFLCDPGDSSTCPATAKGIQGDSYELSGAGTFDAQAKSVKAAGTYTHKSPNGNVLESGVWLANELLSFDSYGIAPAALRQQGIVLGPQPLGQKRLPISSHPMPTGGLAVFRIRFLPMSGVTKTAVLQVNCALGDVPRERSVEGIRLSFESNGGEFSEEVSGRVMFLALRLEVSTPAKAPQQVRTNAAQQPGGCYEGLDYYPYGGLAAGHGVGWYGIQGVVNQDVGNLVSPEGQVSDRRFVGRIVAVRALGFNRVH